MITFLSEWDFETLRWIRVVYKQLQSNKAQFVNKLMIKNCLWTIKNWYDMVWTESKEYSVKPESHLSNKI